MRSIESWEKEAKQFYLKKFPPRIQNDLLQISMPEVNVSENAFIYGETATGKTILACQIMLKEQKRLWLRNGPRGEGVLSACEFVSVPDLINRIKATYATDSIKTEQEILQHYRNLHLLVLDDFGTVKPSDWVLHILYSIINHRYEYLAKTIITSNFSLDEIATRLGDDRITSRIERSYKLIKKKPYKK